MSTKLLTIILLSSLLFACTEKSEPIAAPSAETSAWNLETLGLKAQDHSDTSKWDNQMFGQDTAVGRQYRSVFESYPLNKSPFPVAEYEYAVSSVPFTIETDSSFYRGIRIGEYENFESDKVIEKLTLLVYDKEQISEESTMAESRNAPYLSAQGYFKLSENTYDWVFASSPDGFSILMLNMKLFDLRFGESIVIYPQADNSFYYDQIADSPNNYADFEDYKKSILEKLKLNK